jgi:hypothetical protein
MNSLGEVWHIKSIWVKNNKRVSRAKREYEVVWIDEFGGIATLKFIPFKKTYRYFKEAGFKKCNICSSDKRIVYHPKDYFF